MLDFFICICFLTNPIINHVAEIAAQGSRLTAFLPYLPTVLRRAHRSRRIHGALAIGQPPFLNADDRQQAHYTAINPSNDAGLDPRRPMGILAGASAPLSRRDLSSDS